MGSRIPHDSKQISRVCYIFHMHTHMHQLCYRSFASETSATVTCWCLCSLSHLCFPVRHWYLHWLLHLRWTPLSLVQRRLLGAADPRRPPVPGLRALTQYLLRPTSGHGPLPRPAPCQRLPQPPRGPGQSRRIGPLPAPQPRKRWKIGRERWRRQRTTDSQ